MKISLFTTPGLVAVAVLSGNSAWGEDQTKDAASTARARPHTTEVQEVIVTANRREENVQRVAASITALSGAKLQDEGIRNSNEIADVVPDVTIQTTFQTSAPRIFIRGVGTGDSSVIASSPVGVYVDDIYIGAQDGLILELFDLQRVEVLKGPQGTLYGRNTTAGAINYISNPPTTDFSGNADVRIGDYNDIAAEAAISGPIMDKLLGRFAFSYEHRDGVVTDPITGDHNGNSIQNLGFKGLLYWNPAPKLNINLNLHYTRADPFAGIYKARGYYVPGTTTPCSTPAILAYQCSDVLGYVPSPDLFSVHSILKGHDKNVSYGGGLHIAYDAGWATLTSITGLNQTFVHRLEADDSGSQQRLAEFHFDHHTEEITQELRLTSRGGQRFNWILGAYLYHEKPYSHDDLYAPIVIPLPLDSESGQTDNAYAVYGRADYSITPKLKLALGGRYTVEHKSFFENAGLSPAALAYFGVSVGQPSPPFSLFSLTKKRSDSDPSGDISLSYQFTRDIMAYGTISRGFKSGGFNGGPLVDPSYVTSFAPETLTSYELGVKSSFMDRKLIVDASAFYYDYRDLQVQTLVVVQPGQAPVLVEENAANARVYGLELQSMLRPATGLTLDASVGFLSAKFLSYNSATADLNYTGHTLAGAPGITASFSADYRHAISDRFDGFIGWHSSYKSRDYFDSSNTILVSQAPYWLTNAEIGFGPSAGNWKASFWVKNLFDERYYRDIINFETTLGYDLTTVGDPRTFGLEISTRW